MKYFLTVLFAVLFAGSSFAQRVDDLFTTNTDATNIGNDLAKYVDKAIVLKINSNAYSSITASRSDDLTLRVPLTDQSSVNLVLKKFEVLTPDAKIIGKTAAGDEVLNIRNVVLSYRGTIEGISGSFVTVTFYNGMVMGIVSSSKETYVLGKLGEENVPGEDYVIYQESSKKGGKEFKCGSENMETPEAVLEAMRNYDPSRSLTTNILKANVAIDIDHFTYNFYGANVNNATAWGLALMSSVSAVYLKDMNIQISVPYLRVWQTPDPYTSTGGNSLLNQFRSEWINTQGAVSRTVAHLLSRRTNLDVAGIAYVGVLCNTNFGYGLSATLNGTINPLPSYSYDVVVTAHEVGHNFGSPHTHDCSWSGGPLDTCVEIEGGACYNGPTHPTAGSIMSYCDIVPGGSVYMDFDAQPEALIRTSAENAGCMTAVSSLVMLGQPNGGETYRTGNTLNIFWASNLAGNANVEYSSNNGNTWQTIQNNVPSNVRTIPWVIPQMGSTTTARVRIMDATNPAIGDTTDGTFRIILNLNAMNPVFPPTASRIETSQNNFNLNHFTWTKAGTHPTITYKWKIRKAAGNDLIFTANNSGSDSVMSLRNSQLDSIAQTLGTTGDSVLTIWRAWAFNGVDSLASNPFILTLRRTTVGISVLSTEIPKKFSLENNYPNPFNPVTNIKFDIPKSSFVELKVYDSRGSEIAVLVNDKLQPGSYEYKWEGSKFASGVYFYRLRTSEFTQTKRMILVK